MAHGNGNGNGNGNGRKALAVKTSPLPEMGHGRPTDAFRSRMQMVLERAKAAEVIERGISGDILEQIATKDGPVVGQIAANDRLNYIKFAAYYAHGMPVQQVEAKVAHIMIQVDV